MRDRSEVKITREYRKQVECLICGCVYAVGELRRVTGVGSTEVAASHDADRAAGAWAERRKPKGPCPTCGRLPAGVVSRARRYRHGLILGPGLLAIVAAFSPAYLGNPFNSDKVAYMIAGGVLFSGLAHAWLTLHHPHNNPAANRRRAEDAVQRGSVVVVRPGCLSDPRADARACRKRTVLALIVGGSAAVLALAAPAYRAVNGWRIDPGMRPGVCGPGEEVRVYFDQRVQGLDNTWRGQPKGVLEYTVGGQEKRVPATVRAQSSAWNSNEIRARRTGLMSVWVDLEIPRDAQVGETVRGEVEMDVTYPTPAPRRDAFNESFTEAETPVSKVFNITVASPGAGAVYSSLFWGGSVGACVLVVMLGLGYSETGYPARRSRVRMFAAPAPDAATSA